MFSKQSNKSDERLQRMSIHSIKDAIEGITFKNWYFNACILTYPQTMIIEQQIRQAIFVYQERKPQQVLVVILCEPAVRKYCNMIKPFKKFQFINGVIKTSHLNNNFVLMTQESKIIQIQNQKQQTSKNSSVIQKIFASKNNNANKQKNQRTNKSSVSLNIPNTNFVKDYDNQSFQDSYYSNPIVRSKVRSQKNQSKTEKNIEQLVNFCGTVAAVYQVGKGRMNHGVGYRIQQCFSKATYEVVIWCEMQLGQLKKGRTYEFNNFRPHKKQNLEISYHSHPQYSTINQLY